MKQSEIKKGKFYTNGKGDIRQVEEFIPTYNGKDDVYYWDPTKKKTGQTWLPYFARWAKAEIKEKRPCGTSS